MPQNIEHCNYSLACLPCCLQIDQTQAGIAPSETEESCIIASSFTKHGLHTKWHQPFLVYEGGSICNENPFITPSTNALGFNAICQIKDQSVAVIMVHETLLYLSKFDKLQTF